MTFLMIDSLCLAGSVRRETVCERGGAAIAPASNQSIPDTRTSANDPVKPRQLRFGRGHSPALLIGVDIGLHRLRWETGE